ncbi:MAG: hypothetical protein QOJ52_2787 [Acidimicrobiaceae bacterium]|nr:hypothetical protein [Acidimicrobiaceae bacterium]
MPSAGLPSSELPAGEGIETQIHRVRVGDGHVLVARLTTGEVVAFAPVCPHQFTELDEATIREGSLRCPRHGYLYDTRTGENIHPGRETAPENMWKVRPGFLPCYQVREDDGWISVSDDPCSPPLSYDPVLEERPARGDEPLEPLAAVPVAEVPAVAAAAAVAVAEVAEVAAEVVAPTGGPDGGPTGGPAAVEPAGGPVAVEQSMKFLTVASGSTFDIRLPLIPRPGFTWRFDIVGELLQVVDEQFEPGYSPCHLIRVAAQGVGAATLSCTYASEAGERAEVRTFIVRVQPT